MGQAAARATARARATATVQLDNERARVTRWDFSPGEETGEHVHEYDYCVVPLSDGELTIVAPDGSKITAALASGVSYFRNRGVHHNVINSGSGNHSFVEIEFK